MKKYITSFDALLDIIQYSDASIYKTKHGIEYQIKIHDLWKMQFIAVYALIKSRNLYLKES